MKKFNGELKILMNIEFNENKIYQHFIYNILSQCADFLIEQIMDYIINIHLSISQISLSNCLVCLVVNLLQ